MKKVLVSVLQALVSTALTFMVLEGVFFLAGSPPGANTFTENIILRERLSPKKPAGEFRIFTYGESTMHGSSYWPYSNPARWLTVYLKDFLPDRKIRVVNFSRVGQGSASVFEAFNQTLAYHPDIMIFYIGHNQLLPGNQVDEVDKKTQKIHYRLRKWTQRSRFISALYRIALQIKLHSKGKKALEDSLEYQVIETPPMGVSIDNAAPRSSPAYNRNMVFFRQKVESILDTTQKKNIHVLFFKPAGNLKDFAPYYSLHRTDLSLEKLAQWETFYKKGMEAQKQGRQTEALEVYEKAYRMDPTYADLCFRFGQILFQTGNLERARQLFKEARDEDALSRRASSDIDDIFERLEKTRGLELIETEKVLSPEAPGGILGEPVIEDNVHFSVKGQALAGRAAAEAIANRNWIAPRSEWKFERERPFEEIRRELGIDQEVLYNSDLKLVNYFGSRFENRLRIAKRALQIHPTEPRGLRYLAWTYWLMGQRNEALKVYQKLGQSNPSALAEVFQVRPEIKKVFEENGRLGP